MPPVIPKKQDSETEYIVLKADIQSRHLCRCSVEPERLHHPDRPHSGRTAPSGKRGCQREAERRRRGEPRHYRKACQKEDSKKTGIRLQKT